MNFVSPDNHGDDLPLLAERYIHIKVTKHNSRAKQGGHQRASPVIELQSSIITLASKTADI
jgi:hypothetical protein